MDAQILNRGPLPKTLSKTLSNHREGLACISFAFQGRTVNRKKSKRYWSAATAGHRSRRVLLAIRCAAGSRYGATTR